MEGNGAVNTSEFMETTWYNQRFLVVEKLFSFTFGESVHNPTISTASALFSPANLF
jgi:hypothetical protein